MGDNRVALSVLWNTEIEDLELDGKMTICIDLGEVRIRLICLRIGTI
jgi:hypothetical protein